MKKQICNSVIHVWFPRVHSQPPAAERSNVINLKGIFWANRIMERIHFNENIPLPSSHAHPGRRRRRRTY